ncbi:MAG TPA: hypothetical protein VGM39_14005 [Kofleriaceae bacterium]|jgi:hypothetical protein
MNDMAAVAPSSSDARVPCPACGTLIHPVAGRCKHCKQDIAQLRGMRPAANAALPALAPRATPVAGTPMTAATIESAPVAAPTATTLVADALPGVVAPKIASPFPTGEVERAYDPTRPVLPPRVPVGHGVAKNESWFARNWPIVVIVLASAAIIAAVVLMMLPPKEAGAGKKNGAGAPAPDRMDTDQLPEQPKKADPWSGASPPPAPTPPPAQAAPDPQLGQQAPAPSDPFAQNTPPDPNDPLSPDPFAGGMPGINQNAIALSQALAAHLCDKAAACSSADPGTQQMCSMMSSMPKMSLPQNCAAAKECLDTIDRMDVCGAMANSIDPLQVMQTASSCIKAMSSC